MLLTGCEDVINIDLQSVGPHLVIEGNIDPRYGTSYIAITRSLDFYDPEFPTVVSGALVIVMSPYETDTVQERAGQPGLYEPFQVHAEPGDTVRASVTVDGEVYTAISVMSEPILIDSISLEYQPGGGLGPEQDEGYRLHVHFRDRPNYADYARLRVRRNGALIDSYNLYDGKYSDGNAIDYSYFSHTLQPGDGVAIELWSMSKPLYDYFSTLFEVTVTEDGSNNLFDITPANPNTNWDNGALGYFGIVNIDFKSYIIVGSQSNPRAVGVAADSVIRAPKIHP